MSICYSKTKMIQNSEKTKINYYAYVGSIPKLTTYVQLLFKLLIIYQIKRASCNAAGPRSLNE